MKKMLFVIAVCALVFAACNKPLQAQEDTSLSKSLYIAVLDNNFEEIKRLVELGADMNLPIIKDNPNSTPFHAAVGSNIDAKKNNDDIIKFLINKGANVNLPYEEDLWEYDIVVDTYKMPLFFRFTENGKEELLKLSVLKGANLKATDERGRNILIYAIRNGNRNAVEFLISKGFNVNVKYKDNWRILSYAVARGSKDITELLIANGAKVNIKTYSDKSSLLHIATKGNWSSKVAELLIAKGVKVNAKDKYNKTPLHYAAQFKNKEIIEFLVSKGADVNAKDKDSMTPLDYTDPCEEEKDIRDLLISYGAKSGKDLK